MPEHSIDLIPNLIKGHKRDSISFCIAHQAR